MALAKKESFTLATELGPVADKMTEAIAAIKNGTGDASAVGDNIDSLHKKLTYPGLLHETKSKQLYFGDHLANIGAAQILISYIQWLREMEHGESHEAVFPFLMCCQNFAFYSPKFSEELGKAGIIPILVEYLQEFKESWTNNHWNESMVRGSLSTCIAMSRKTPSIRPLFRANNAIGCLIPYLKADDERFKMWATLTLAYVIDAENLSIMADPSVIRFIVEVFKKTVDHKNTRYETGNTVYYPTELAMGIERLAVNDTPGDNNKLALVAEGVLPPLFQLMSEGDEEEQLHAIRAISQLAFHPSNRERIRPAIPQLKKFKKSGNPDVAKVASGALWLLQNEESRQQNFRKSDRHAGHVMLSYQWDDQEIVKQIKNRLQMNGYKVWMDIDKMGGSTFQAMAEAVENAAVVLLCMSLKYKESYNCRLECEYAGTKRKPIIPLKMQNKYEPDGWLGLIVGARLYFNFAGKDSFKDVMERLIKELKGVKEAATEVDATASQLEGLKLHNWTQEDVKSWIQENQLEGDFESLVPEDLRFLQRIKKEAPVEFYSSIRDELGQTSISRKRKFCDALEKLE